MLSHPKEGRDGSAQVPKACEDIGAKERRTWKRPSHPRSVKYEDAHKLRSPQLLHGAAGLPAPTAAGQRMSGQAAWSCLACGITARESSCGGALPGQETLEHGSEAYGGGQMNKSHMQFITFNRTVCVLSIPSVCQKIKYLKRTQK